MITESITFRGKLSNFLKWKLKEKKSSIPNVVNKNGEKKFLKVYFSKFYCSDSEKDSWEFIWIIRNLNEKIENFIWIVPHTQ